MVVDRPRVLIVEDNQEIRELIRQFLDLQGFDVVGSAADGAEGADLYHQTKPDAIVSDLRMPNVDGLELAQLVRAADNETAIVVFTAHDRDEVRMRALSELPKTMMVAKGRLKDLAPAITQLLEPEE